MKIAIKVTKTGRYIKWCDDCWYETSKTPYSIACNWEDVKRLRKQLKKHYIYETKLEKGKEDVYVN